MRVVACLLLEKKRTFILKMIESSLILQKQQNWRTSIVCDTQFVLNSEITGKLTKSLYLAQTDFKWS